MRDRVTFSYEPNYDYSYWKYNNTIFFSYSDIDIHRDNVRYTYAHDGSTAELRSTLGISYSYINPIGHSLEVHNIEVYDRHIYRYIDETYSGSITINLKPLFENKLVNTNIFISIPTNTDVFVINTDDVINGTSDTTITDRAKEHLQRGLTDMYGNIHTLVIYVHIIRLNHITQRSLPNEITSFKGMDTTYALYYIPGYNNEYELGTYYIDKVYDNEIIHTTDDDNGDIILTSRGSNYIGGMTVKYNLTHQKMMAKVHYDDVFIIRLFNYMTIPIKNEYLYEPSNCWDISFINAPEIKFSLEPRRGADNKVDRLVLTNLESNHIGTALMRIAFSYEGYHYEKVSEITFCDLLNNIDQLVDLEWVVNSTYDKPKTRLLEGDIINYAYANTDPMRANCKVTGYFGYHPIQKDTAPYGFESIFERTNHDVEPLAWHFDGTYIVNQLYNEHDSEPLEHNSYFTHRWNGKSIMQSMMSYVAPVDVVIYVDDEKQEPHIAYSYFDITTYILENTSDHHVMIGYINPEYHNSFTDASRTYFEDSSAEYERTLLDNDTLQYYESDDRSYVTYFYRRDFSVRELGLGCHRFALVTSNNNVEYEGIQYIQSVYHCGLTSISNEPIYDLCKYNISDILMSVKHTLRNGDPNVPIINELAQNINNTIIPITEEIDNLHNVEVICNDEAYEGKISVDWDIVEEQENNYVVRPVLYIDKLINEYKVIGLPIRLFVYDSTGNRFVFDITLDVHLGEIGVTIDLYDNDTLFTSSNIIRYRNTDVSGDEYYPITYMYDYSAVKMNNYYAKINSLTHYYNYSNIENEYYYYDHSVESTSEIQFNDTVIGNPILMNNIPGEGEWQGSTYIAYLFQYSNYMSTPEEYYQYVTKFTDNTIYKKLIFEEMLSAAKADLNNIPSYIYLFSQFGVIDNEYKNPWVNERCSIVHGENTFEQFTFGDTFNYNETVYEIYPFLLITQDPKKNEIQISLNVDNIGLLTDSYNEITMTFYCNSNPAGKVVHIRIINDLRFFKPNSQLSLAYIDKTVTGGTSDYKEYYTFKPNNNTLSIRSNSLETLSNDHPTLTVCNLSIQSYNGNLIFKIEETLNNNLYYKLYNNYFEYIKISTAENIVILNQNSINTLPYTLKNNDSLSFDDANNSNTTFTVNTESYRESSSNNYLLKKDVNININDISSSLMNGTNAIEIYTNGK